MSVRRAQDERLEGTPDGLNAITEISDVPDAPTIGTATAGVGSASVTFTAAATGGSVNTYRALSTPGSIVGTSATSPITVSGLTGGTAYTFQVRGENSTGNSSYSSASNSVTPIATSFESIATIDAGGQTQVAFTSIPSTFTHLQIRCIVRSNNNMSNYNIASIVFRVNGASIRGELYSRHYAIGDNFTTVGYGNFSEQEALLVPVPTANVNANVFGTAVIDILDYKNTNKFKTWRVLAGANDNTSNLIRRVDLQSMLFQETAAISSIYMSTDYTYSWTNGTRFALYGIKTA